MLKRFGRFIGSSFYPPGLLLALELQNWNRRGTTGRKQALTDPDLFDGRMRANVVGCPAYLLKIRDYLCPIDSAATRPITVGSVPTPEMRSAVRQNGQCSGDLRDVRQQSNASHLG